jgi:mycothiol synthase
MAILSSAISSFRGGEPPRIERVREADRREALSILLTGRAAGGEAQVDQFLAFADEQSLHLGDLWAAWVGDRPRATVLLVASPGRTAMLFCAPVASRSEVALQGQVIERACAAQDRTRARIIQSLLDPPQTLERRALERAGFEALATLIYMQRSPQTSATPTPLDLGAGLEVRRWRDELRPQFARAVLASYEGTLDCPGLLGMRPIDDVIDGHRGTGQFDPALWFTWWSGDEPAGVMLLSRVRQRGAVELVYLGLSPAWRGRGLARRMMHLGLELAGEAGAAAMVLAVDERNVPALTLYRGLGFRPTARKVAMILPPR